VPKRTRIKPITDIDDPRYVKALSHPLRIRILALLQERDASPVQLAEHLDATLGTVAYHVRTLQRLGLVDEVATHQRRGATEHVFAVREHPRLSDLAWSQASPMAKHVFVSSLLSQAGDFASQSAARGGFDRADAHATRNALKLDEKGWTALAAASKKWLDDIKRIEAQAEKRMRRADETAFDVGVVILLFEAVPFFEAKAAAGNGEATAPSRSTSKVDAH
jgi:DNA-binding transcriptional ArsR family regulator